MVVAIILRRHCTGNKIPFSLMRNIWESLVYAWRGLNLTCSKNDRFKFYWLVLDRDKDFKAGKQHASKRHAKRNTE